MINASVRIADRATKPRAGVYGSPLNPLGDTRLGDRLDARALGREAGPLIVYNTLELPIERTERH